MSEKKFGTCPRCNAPCEVAELIDIHDFDGDTIDVPYDQYQYHPQHGAVWVKANLDDRNTIPSASCLDLFIKYDNGQQKMTGGRNLIIELLENGWLDVQWLDESGTAPAVTPTFWDVAKAFKWAAEYRDEIGGQLTLYNDQWTLISEDEDGNENDTKDLTPGNVAELYCLQNGFNKENEGTAAGKEEDTVALIKFIRLNYRRRKDVWTDNFNIAKLTDEGILGLFKQQKEK